MAIIPQTQSFKLFGAGASVGATSIVLQSFKNIDGTNLTMAHFGGTKGFLTIEPSSGTQEEQISFASITNNANGTVTLGTVKNVLDYTPFTETTGLLKTHGGNVEVIVSNTSGFYNNIIDGTTASQIVFTPSGTISATNVQSAIQELDTETQASLATLDGLVVHKAGAENITGVKTFDSTTGRPRLSVDVDSAVATDIPTVGQLSRSVSAGASNASTTVKGIVQEATQSEVDNMTATGSTGARLYINPSTAPLQSPFINDGSDGSVTISSGTTTLTRNMYYANLTVNGTGTLVTAGYKIYVKGTTTIDTSGGGGGIQWKGANGTAGSGVNGGAAAAALAQNLETAVPVGGTAGTAGGNSGSSGTVPTAGTSNSYVVNPANGSNGGGAGVGGTSTIPVYVRDIFSATFPYKLTSTTAIKLAFISSGAAGGQGGFQNGTGQAGGGGGAGATGGYVYLVTKYLVVNGTSCLNANGGAGGNGGQGTGIGNGDGGGGGGGGNGGVVFVAYSRKTGTGTLTANGGAGGTGGAANNGGSIGIAGTAGTAGPVIEVTI